MFNVTILKIKDIFKFLLCVAIIIIIGIFIIKNFNMTKALDETMPSIKNLNEEYRKELSNIINYKLKNPNATGLISVTKVKVTNDLKFAKVYVSILNAKDVKQTLAALKSASGFLRSELAKSVNLRNTPELIFELDDSIEYGAKIDSILKEILPKKEEEN